jgi:hypothetical protein
MEYSLAEIWNWIVNLPYLGLILFPVAAGIVFYASVAVYAAWMVVLAVCGPDPKRYK